MKQYGAEIFLQPSKSWIYVGHSPSKKRMGWMFHGKILSLLVAVLVVFTSCHYPMPRQLQDGSELNPVTKDSLTNLWQRHYTFNTNLEVAVDSVNLSCFPVKDCYNMLYRGDRVVVAEFAVHPEDAIDSVWVKLAHSQEIQGWIHERELLRSFVPTDSISQFIYFFSDTHASYFIVILAFFVVVWLLRAFYRKQLRLVYFNDIDSIYPLLLCLLMAFSATIYETMQVFVPETWQQYYFNPTLSPFKVPFILSLFLSGIWLFLIIFLAVLDDIFKQLSLTNALFYLLGLVSCCIFCYSFFIFTTHIYIGYLFLSLFIWIFFRRLKSTLAMEKYCCGNCGQEIGKKGRCPHCGAINE